MLRRHPLSETKPSSIGHLDMFSEQALKVTHDVGPIAKEHIAAMLESGNQHIGADGRRPLSGEP